MKLSSIMKITGEICCVTNLHIGGSKDELEIGGLDNSVIKHPLTGEPYIPGSSLKGVMRCSIERLEGKLAVCQCGQRSCNVCRIFGSLQNKEIGPTRLIVRDAPLTGESRKEFYKLAAEQRSFFGIKQENAIKRTTGTAENPRPSEFVPAGVRFSMELILQSFENDQAEADFNYLRKCLKLVSERYLGGYGSRGYGKVEFIDLLLDGTPFDLDDVKLF